MRRPRSPDTGLASLLVALLVASLLAACSDDEGATPPTTLPAGFEADRCLVRVHGRTETGAPPEQRDGYAVLSPTGNAREGDGHEWVYDTDEHAEEALTQVREAVDAAGCERVVLHGFSNGGGFVGALVCSGEDLDGRLVGAVIDDPVPDEGVVDCRRADGVDAALYWTGALTEAEPGADCDEIHWTCQGDVLLGIDAYADALGVEVQPSPHDEHVWYDGAPEVEGWLVQG